MNDPINKITLSLSLSLCRGMRREGTQIRRPYKFAVRLVYAANTVWSDQMKQSVRAIAEMHNFSLWGRFGVQDSVLGFRGRSPSEIAWSELENGYGFYYIWNLVQNLTVMP